MATRDTDRVVLLRAGGLGDFILTLPLLDALTRHYRRVLLVSAPSRARLASLAGLAPAHLPIDHRIVRSLYTKPLPEARGYFEGADVMYFAVRGTPTLEAGLRSAGACRVRRLDPRPARPPHFTKRLFRTAGLRPPADLTTRAWIGGRAGGEALWIHPGSGSTDKNMPLAYFVRQAGKWRSATGRRVVVSFGEADRHLIAPARAAFGNEGLDVLVEPTLDGLAAAMRREADAFLGNDSGVSHLAAAIGVTTTVAFRTTDPAIWHPLGPDVTVIRDTPRRPAPSTQPPTRSL